MPILPFRSISFSGKLLKMPLQLEIQQDLQHLRRWKPAVFDDLVDLQRALLQQSENPARCVAGILRQLPQRPIDRACADCQLRRDFFDDVIYAFDQLGSLPNQPVRAAAAARARFAWDGKDLPSLFESDLGGDQRAAFFRRLHHHDAE